MQNTIQVPKYVIRELLEVGRKFQTAEDALEDFFLTTDKSFIKRMRRLRTTHKTGGLGDWQKLKTKYGL